MPFSQIIQTLVNSKITRIPISDFLHLLKCLRNTLVKYGVTIDNNNSVAISQDLLKNLNLNKSLTDISAHGKMKDSYPLEIFCSKHIIDSIEKNNYEFIFYSIPFNLLINCIRNPYLSFDLRKYLLETSFYFMMHYFFQFKKSISPPATRIALIRLINTIIGLSIALERYDFIKTGHIGTHPLENFFGSLRIACHNDHSYSSIFRAIGKSIHVRKLLEKMNQDITIKTRLGYGGTEAMIECIGGNIPEITAFQMFKSLWNGMKCENSDSIYFESWFPYFKTIPWDERISSESKLSGSNIISRYINIIDEEKDDSNLKNLKMKKRKIERIEQIKQLKRKTNMTNDEIVSLYIEEPYIFFIKNNSSINSHLEDEDIDYQNLRDFFDDNLKSAMKKINSWIRKASNA